jgi:low affinity Fe/Cu permease
LQRAQAKDMQALHIKLNELIASQTGASNRMLNIESASESELAAMRDLHDRLPKESMESHSLEHVRDRELILGQAGSDQSPNASIIIAER